MRKHLDGTYCETVLDEACGRPHVEPAKPKIQLSDQDGNAFNLLGIAHKAAKQVGWSETQWLAIREEATSGDYDHLIQTLMKYFDVS